jgi:hypothetical protein
MSNDTIYVELTNSNRLFDLTSATAGPTGEIPTTFDVNLPIESGNRIIGPNNRNSQKYRVSLVNLILPNSEISFDLNRYSDRTNKITYDTGSLATGGTTTKLSALPYVYVSLGTQRSNNSFSNNINVGDNNNLQFRVIIDHLNPDTGKLVTLRPFGQTIDLAINLNEKITFSVFLPNGQPLAYQKLTGSTNVTSSEYLFQEISALFSFEPYFNENTNLLS